MLTTVHINCRMVIRTDFLRKSFQLSVVSYKSPSLTEGFLLKTDAKPVACNNGAGGYTERHFKERTHLIEPQGIIKK